METDMPEDMGSGIWLSNCY